MTEKVKITQRQANMIEKYLSVVADEEELLEAFARTKDKQKSIFSALDGLSQMDLARALLIGYEIEPKYKAGDFIVRIDGEVFSTGKKIAEIERIGWSSHDIKIADGRGVSFADIQHATPEEIKAEKERRLWKSIGREVNEFRFGDTVELEKELGFKIYLERQIKVAQNLYENGEITGIYPADSFISFEDGDSND